MKVTVKQARVGVGLTQEDMARRLGVSTSTYAAWEKNPERISYANAVRIAAIAGIEVTDLKMEVA